ncbi:polycystin-2 [Biomphalaria glabrata]|nr:polycystin-2-like [Biomphalaria glabrata]
MLPAHHCHFDIEYVDIEKRQFALTWEKVTLRSIRTGPFSYVQGTPFQTIRHHYPGGGYDAQYSLIDTNPDIIDYLKIKNWVDERTRAVKVEVALFNADTKLLTSIIHVYEFTAVGIFQDTPQVYSFPLFYQPASSVFLRVCILLLFLFTLIFSVKDARDMYYTGLFKYMTSPMAWVNLLDRATCFTVIFMFVLEYEIRKTSVESVQDIYFENKDSETFIDFSAVSDVAYKITLLSCIMATIVFLKVIHQTTNIPSLAQFLKLIPPVLRISYLPILTILYFAILAYFIFVEFEEFATYRSATFTITVMMMNLNVVSALKESYSTLGPMFVTVCMSVLNYIVLNYFIILLNEQYSKICSLSLLLNQGKRHNILQDILKMVKPPKIQEERKRERVEEEEVVDYVVLPEDAKYATDVLEVLDDTETSSEV